MIEIKINPQKQVPFSVIAGLSDIIKKGDVFFFPTDTAYGLGGRFDSSRVIKKIMHLKNRQDDKFTLVAADLQQVEKFFQLSDSQKKVAKAFWPGPLTIIVSKRFSIRVPASRFLRTLAAKAAVPIIATSANISGLQTTYTGTAVKKQFAPKPETNDLILVNAGVLKKIKTSTIVEVRKKRIRIVRPGSVATAEIKKFIAKNPEFVLID